MYRGRLSRTISLGFVASCCSEDRVRGRAAVASGGSEKRRNAGRPRMYLKRLSALCAGRYEGHSIYQSREIPSHEP